MLKRRVLIPILAVVLVAGAGAATLRWTPPGRLVSHYPLDVLTEEMTKMNECAECHETAQFHTCATCHDDHGAVELAEVPFYAVIDVTGDVPEPGFVWVHDILPYPDHPNTHVQLRTFLEEQGVTDFESVTLASNDGGFITVDRDNMTDNALLLPYADGVRFAAEDLHVSTWIKGITRIVVVVPETPLTINGTATSMGRLLLGPTRSVTLEQTDVMLKSEEDGQIRRAKTASRVEGVPVSVLLQQEGQRGMPAAVAVTTGQGETTTLAFEEIQDGLLALIRGQVVLVRPDRGRTEWIEGVVALAAVDQ
jgi:hypothetical protein